MTGFIVFTVVVLLIPIGSTKFSPWAKGVLFYFFNIADLGRSSLAVLILEQKVKYKKLFLSGLK